MDLHFKLEHLENDLTSISSLEKKITGLLNLQGIIVIYVEGGEAHFCVQNPDPLEGGAQIVGEGICQTLKQYECTMVDVDEDEDVFVNEEEAVELWRVDNDRTSHLPPFPSPDGHLVNPSHEINEKPQTDIFAPQLLRDPNLFTFDNVRRVSIENIGQEKWEEPVIITTNISSTSSSSCLSCDTLVECFGEAEVRTGNRETLSENGFNNSAPMKLCDALGPGGGGASPECSRIVFSPLTELPAELQQNLVKLSKVFPNIGPIGPNKKFTLCIGSSGFGIGFHKHNAALFLLVEGRKKWYMSSEDVENDLPTHPGFFKEKSSHKVIQVPGEILFVPELWYHEIYNLSYTAGLQALPC